MLRRTTLLVVAFNVLSVVGFAGNLIREWGGAQGGYEVHQGDARVLITAPGTYKFQATDPNGYLGLGTIDHLTVDPNCPTGLVSVYVVRDPNEVEGAEHEPGALHLKEINLLNASVSAVPELQLAGDLGELAPVLVDTLGDCAMEELLNDVTVADLSGTFACIELNDDLTITEGGSWPDIVIDGDINGTIYTPLWLGHVHGGDLNGRIEAAECLSLGLYSVAPGAVVDVTGELTDFLVGWGDLEGFVQIGGGITWLYIQRITSTGTLEIHGDGPALEGWGMVGINYGRFLMHGEPTYLELYGVGAGGRATFYDITAGDWIQVLGNITGIVEIKGDMRGALDVTGNVVSPGGILITGVLGDVTRQTTARVTVSGALTGTNSYIAQDWDGWDYGDHPWVNGQVQVGSTTYYGNAHWARVYEITQCKGDMDNSGGLDYLDADPM